MPRYNPFRPGCIVTPGMFCGRLEELRNLEQILFQTKNENPNHFLIHGERGIGKSSLLFYLECVARGDIKPLDGHSYKFLTVNVELEPSNSYFDIIGKVGAELQRVVSADHRVKELARTAWEFLKRWEVMGVKYSDAERVVQPYALLDDLTHTVCQTVAATSKEYDGILILIDEADKPLASANLGEFVKVFTERLSKRGCGRVALGVAGLSAVLQRLRDSHESAPRIFELLTLEPLSEAERMQVVRKGLQEAQRKNGFEVRITRAAEECISEISDGYPHFIQQFSYSAFNEDSDNLIDENDVMQGSFRENGAFQQLGLKYFQELYFDQIGSNEYRAVLRAMSEHLDSWVTKEQIRQAVNMKEPTLNNAINALKTRHIIIPKQGEKGVYRLPSKSFAVWIKAFTQACPAAGPRRNAA